MIDLGKFLLDIDNGKSEETLEPSTKDVHHMAKTILKLICDGK